MNLPPIPKLPAALVAVLGLLASVLLAVGPTLPSPWHEVAAAALAVLTWLGVVQTRAAQQAHADTVADHVANGGPR